MNVWRDAELARLRTDNIVGSRKIVDQNDEIARLTALVKSAYNEGFNEGMNEVQRVSGGKTWLDYPKSRLALRELKT